MKQRSNMLIVLFSLTLIGFTTLGIKFEGKVSSKQNDAAIAVVPDPSQRKVAAVPVIVTSIGFVVDKEKSLEFYKGYLENRSPKAVISVRIRWKLIADEDRELKNPLNRGETAPISVRVEGNDKREVEFPIPKFHEITKPLVKSKSLHGKYFLIAGVSEVLFEDGSSWKEEETIFSNIRYNYTSGISSKLNGG